MGKTTFVFDKFIKDIVEREDHTRNVRTDAKNSPEETGPRKYRRLYAERWQNRIVWASKKHNDK